jgi:sugar lactone lactonase YvrE
MSDWELLVDGVDFGEGPRWRDGVLWYSDFYQRAIYNVTESGERTVAYGDLSDRPSGLGWLPDGTLLVVSMENRQVLKAEGDSLVLHADLSEMAAGRCNDMVVSASGNAYVGNFGFDLEANDEPAVTDLHLVRPDGSVEVAATDLFFPNGSVITPDGATLIVGETFGSKYSAFDINADGTLTNRRVWAEAPGTAPDGCSLDTDGAIWFSDAVGSQVVRIHEGGEISETVATPMPTFACVLGGADGTTLFALCSPGSHPDEVAGKGGGAIYRRNVAAPHAGLP